LDLCPQPGGGALSLGDEIDEVGQLSLYTPTFAGDDVDFRDGDALQCGDHLVRLVNEVINHGRR